MRRFRQWARTTSEWTPRRRLLVPGYVQDMTIGWEALGETLELGPQALVAFVGGGGKTTSVFALGRHRPGRTVITTTTKMGVERTGGHPVLIDAVDAELDRALDDHRCVVAWHHLDGHRAVGVSPETCDRWMMLADTVAVEADGSRRMPFKAPRDYEPVIPSASTHVVACVGVAAVGVPIVEGCQRPERVAAIVGCHERDVLSPERLARVLLSPAGSRKGVPAGARFSVLVNRVTEADRSVVDELRKLLGDVPLTAVADVPIDRLPDVV